MPVADVPRQPRLGLRRRLRLRAAPRLRRPATASRGSSTPPTARASASSSTSSTTTSAPGQRGAAARSARTSPTGSTRRRGARRSTSRSPAVREWAIQNAELLGARLPASTACGSTRSTRSTTTRPTHVLAELADRVHAVASRRARDHRDGRRPTSGRSSEWGHDAHVGSTSLHHALHVAADRRARRLLRGRSTARDVAARRTAAALARAGGAPTDRRRCVRRTTTRSATARSATGCRRRSGASLAAVRRSSAPTRRCSSMGEEYGERRAVPVLHRPHRPVDRRRDARGPAARVRRTSPASRARSPTRRTRRPSSARSSRARGDPALSELYARRCSACGASCRARLEIDAGRRSDARTLELRRGPTPTLRRRLRRPRPLEPRGR